MRIIVVGAGFTDIQLSRALVAGGEEVVLVAGFRRSRRGAGGRDRSAGD